MNAGKAIENLFHGVRSMVGAWKCRHVWKHIEPRKVVFNQFQGSGFGCNQKYIALELLRRRTDLDLVWLVKDANEGGFPAGIRKVAWKSPQAMQELATARVWCANHNLGHFVKNRGLVKKPGQFYLQTWHGSFGIKRCTETLGAKEAKMLDVFMANCEWEAGLARDWFAPATPRIVCAGHPRNDIIARRRAEAANRQPPTASCELQTLLYVPTFRDDGATDCYLTDFTKILAALERRWPGGWKVQVRLHPHMRKKGIRFAFTPQVEDVTAHPDIQELLANADAVISDYSSCMFDFSLSRRPAFIYAPDREKYETERGFYYPLSETPFPVAESADALAAAMASFDESAYAERLEGFFRRMGNAEDGHAAERAADEILAAIDAPCPSGCNGGYSVSIVADTHYDVEQWEKYHANFKNDELKSSHAAIAGMWKQRIPTLLDAAKKCMRGDTAFTLHMGDFINGGTGDADTLRKMLDAGYAAHREYFEARPLQLVAGNHDVLCSGDGTKKYREWLGGETNRMFRQGEDAWMVFDYNAPPAIETVKKWFAESENARWTFIVSHMPIVPCGDLGPRRLLYGEQDQAESRQELLRMVAARRNCIVLAAHVHSISYSVFSFPEGSVVQFVANSIWKRDDAAKIRLDRRNLKNWYAKTKLEALEPAVRDDLLDTIEPYRPHVREFRSMHAAAHFLLEVTPQKVQVLIFGGCARKPTMKFMLKKHENR